MTTNHNMNTGHGHVRPRPDGVKARCGGPGFCKVCSAEKASIATESAPAAGAASIELWAEPNMTARHIRTGGLYTVQGFAKCKINEVWQPVVIYRACDRDEVFARETEPFCRNFERVAETKIPAQTASIDTPEFRVALAVCTGHLDYYQDSEHEVVRQSRAALIDHINAWGTQQREEGRREGHEAGYVAACEEDPEGLGQRAEKAEAALKEEEARGMKANATIERYWSQIISLQSQLAEQTALAQRAAGDEELPPLTMSVYGTRTALELERQRRADIASRALGDTPQKTVDIINWLIGQCYLDWHGNDDDDGWSGHEEYRTIIQLVRKGQEALAARAVGGVDLKTSGLARYTKATIPDYLMQSEFVLLEDAQSEVMKAERDALAAASAPVGDGDERALMDWLDSQEHVHALKWRCGENVKTALHDRDRKIIGEGPTFREAIRAALTQQKG